MERVLQKTDRARAARLALQMSRHRMKGLVGEAIRVVVRAGSDNPVTRELVGEMTRIQLCRDVVSWLRVEDFRSARQIVRDSRNRLSRMKRRLKSPPPSARDALCPSSLREVA